MHITYSVYFKRLVTIAMLSWRDVYRRKRFSEKTEYHWYQYFYAVLGKQVDSERVRYAALFV